MMIIIATVILGILYGAYLLMPQGRKPGKVVAVKSNAKESKLYTRAEIALHNKRTDCWIIIKNKVFDVTPYVEEHPGGDAILVHAGDDSTEGFYGPQHGTRVFDLIDDFCIGELQKINL